MAADDGETETRDNTHRGTRSHQPLTARGVCFLGSSLQREAGHADGNGSVTRIPPGRSAPGNGFRLPLGALASRPGVGRRRVRVQPARRVHQREGARIFPKWAHQHAIIAADDGAELNVSLEYEVPPGIYNTLTNSYVIRDAMTELVRKQTRAIADALERGQ